MSNCRDAAITSRVLLRKTPHLGLSRGRQAGTATAQEVANPADLLLKGFSHGAAGAGARERGAPESPVFGAAENAPKLCLQGETLCLENPIIVHPKNRR
jgi:hypothetical protein